MYVVGLWRCNCTEGVSGDVCQFVASATFSGDTVIEVSFPGVSNDIPAEEDSENERSKRQSQSAPVSVQLSLVTTVNTGIIFFALGVRNISVVDNVFLFCLSYIAAN